MALTRRQIMTAQVFHEPREDKPGQCHYWRRNGATQTWKARPDDFRLPVRYGLRGYSNIRPVDADQFHAEEDCPHGNRA